MSKQCPNCKQYKVISQAGQTVITGFGLNCVGVIFLILFFPVGIALIGIGWVVIILASIAYFLPGGRKKFYCNNCKNKWEV